MTKAILTCPTCNSTLLRCEANLPAIGSFQPPGTCSATYCPNGHGVMANNGKCPIDLLDCPVRPI
jgi:hypothetical protein